MASLADAEQTLRSTNAKANFQRLTRLLICGGTKLLREKFDCIHKPTDLPKKLSDPATIKQLKGAHLTKDEWKCLYPCTGTYGKSSDFDITLTFRLFRHICSLTPPSGSGWDKLPIAFDHSLEADLARIKYYRNKVHAHTTTMEIPDDEFGILWKEISEALLRIAAGISHVKRDEWKKSIDKFMSDDPLTPEAERFADELQLWCEHDRDVKKELQNVGEKVDGSCKNIEELCQEFRRFREDVRESSHIVGTQVRIEHSVETMVQGGIVLFLEQLKGKRVIIIQVDDDVQEQAAGVESGLSHDQRTEENRQELPKEKDFWDVVAKYTDFFSYLEYLEDKCNVILQYVETGSLLVTVKCSSLQILEELWQNYISGHLNEVAQKIFVTDDVLEKLGLTGVRLKTTISEEEYKNGKQILVDKVALQAPSKSSVDQIKKEMECPVCREQFSEIKEPKILKCLHTFCKTCLKGWLRRQQHEGQLSCPMCREITEFPNNNIDILPSNLFYKQLMKIVKAASEGVKTNYPKTDTEKLLSQWGESKPDATVFELYTMFKQLGSNRASDALSLVSLTIKSSSVPPEILARGALALEAYNNALRKGTTCVKRVPVMLIGQNRSGKTSLKKSLRGQPFNPDEDSTVGIDKDPSHFKITTKIWKAEEKGEPTNSDTVISFEHHAAQLIVSELVEEKRTSADGVVKSRSASLSSVHESAESRKFGSNEKYPNSEERGQVTRPLDWSFSKPSITSADSVQSPEFPSTLSGSPNTNVLNSKTSVAPRGDHLSKPSDKPNVPDEIAAQVAKLLLEASEKEDEQDIHSVFWDFGGQSIYYVTRPLFLSPRAIYLLVNDLSRNPHDKANPIVKQGMFREFEDTFGLRTNLDYLDLWMTSVACLSSQGEVRQEHSGSKSEVLPQTLPPVFFVCTHADKPQGGADPFALAYEIFDSLQRKPYSGHLVDHFFVVDNTKSGSRSECAEVIRLRHEILAVAKELPQMKEAIPIKWLKYEKALRTATEEEGFTWISLETAKQIASEVCEINDNEEFSTLLNFLHDQRFLIHFDDTAVLNNLVVLDLQWLGEMFKMVITVRPYNNEEREFKELWRKLETTGVLEETLLEHVWGPLLKQRETSQSLIEIMEKFSLLCPWPLSDASCGKQYLVPSALMSFPQQKLKNLVTSAQIPSLFLKFESVQIPPGFFPRLVLQFFRWCTEEFPTQVTPLLFHNFARFYISSDTGCSIVLLCHLSAVEVVFLGKCRDVSVTESSQLEVNLSKEVPSESFDVTSAVVLRKQLALMIDSIRQEFCWLKNMRCAVSFLCPVCSNGGAVDYCRNHRKEGCEQEECLHFFSELELIKSENIITCKRSGCARDSRVQIHQFAPWFAFDCGKNQMGSEDSCGLLPSEQTTVIQRRQENSLALPLDVVQILQSPCPPQEVVVQLQEHLQLNQSSLNEPYPETKKWIRCLATEAKRSNRLDVVRHLRDISPAGTTGPLLPEQLDIQNIPVHQMRELTINLSGGDEWMLVAEKLGLTPKQIRYLDKWTMNPCDVALSFISQQYRISVGELYDLLNECGLPRVADCL